jgi:hypothetical protein
VADDPDVDSVMGMLAWIHPAVLAEYALGLGVRVRRSARGQRRHRGTVPDIVRACVDACWDGQWYVASPGHFRMFWTRDLAFAAPALARSSERDRARVHASFERALDVWIRRRSHVTTTIHFFDHPGDAFAFGVDSVPLLLSALRAIGADDLIDRHRSWLADEVAHYCAAVVDSSTGLVRADRTFSAHRDTVVNGSTAYANSMVALLDKTLAETGWFDSPLARFFDGDPGCLLREHFWRGDRFIDTLGGDRTSGEANVWPFWTGVIGDREMLTRALATLAREGFADPLPLRYETTRRPEREVWVTRHLLPGYQGSTIWTSIGSMYLWLLHAVDPSAAERGIRSYSDWIRRDGTFWEVLDEDGRCWVSSRRLFVGEESMLWGAIFLDLVEHPDREPPLLSPPR